MTVVNIHRPVQRYGTSYLPATTSPLPVGQPNTFGVKVDESQSSGVKEVLG